MYNKKNKYSNKKVDLNGQFIPTEKLKLYKKGEYFHSRWEWQCCKILESHFKNRLEYQIELQHEIELIPSFRYGKLIRGLKYEADFVIYEKISTSEVRTVAIIDAKGFQTDISKIKMKMLAYSYAKTDNRPYPHIFLAKKPIKKPVFKIKNGKLAKPKIELTLQQFLDTFF